MRPEEIEGKEFLVSLRGYDKDDVRSFLREVAAEYRKLAEGEAPEDNRLAPPPAPPMVTGDVADMMRAVVAEAAQIRAEAERDAERIRAAAERAKGSMFERVLRALGDQ